MPKTTMNESTLIRQVELALGDQRQDAPLHPAIAPESVDHDQQCKLRGVFTEAELNRRRMRGGLIHQRSAFTIRLDL